MNSKAQADVEFAHIAKERQCQTSWIHQVFAHSGNISGSSKRMTMHDLRDENNQHDWLLRELNSSEIKILQTNGCHCSDWSLLRLLVGLPNNESQEEEDVAQLLRHYMTNTTFAGRVVFLLEHQQQDINNNTASVASVATSWTNVLPRGIHHNGVISDSILTIKTSWVWHNTIISNSFIAAHAVVLRCGVIRTSPTTSRQSSSSNSRHIHDAPLALTVGPESGGGRHLRLSAQATMKEVQAQLQFDNLNDGSMSDHNNISIFDWNIIGQKATLRDTATVESIYMHAASVIEGAASVKRTILFPQATIGAASTVSNVRLQWKACIGSQSCISDTLLMECAEAGPQSIVANAVLGPDTHVSAGEVHGSVLGPNTNAHHQSLVIGLLWPFGRGNVGYGANVGSNHTGRLPDQESCSGEGTFWGLSSVVVFPVNLLDAPYSIVAAGTTLKSQRLPPMPFSLLVNDNSLIPAWVLTSSLYTLVRSEMKFANRRKAKRHAYYTGWKIVRPEMIDLCQTARGILQSQSSYSTALSSLYKWSDEARQKGIQAYTDCIQRYLLQGLLSVLLPDGDVVVGGGATDAHRVQSIRFQPTTVEALLNHEFFKDVSNNEQRPNLGVSSSNCGSSDNAKIDARSPTQWPASPWDETDPSSSEWLHQRKLLLEEFPRPTSSTWTLWVCNTLLPKLIHLENEYAERVFQSKARDDERGKTIIPGYEKSHEPAAKDPVILHVRQMAKETTDKVTMILQQIHHDKKSRL